MRFRNCLGMIWSVSTSSRSSGTASPVCVRNASMVLLILKFPIADIGKVAGQGGGGGHHGTAQMGASACTLGAFKVAVAGGSATLGRGENIGVHAQAHGASRFAPLKTSRAENGIQTLAFGGLLHHLRAGHNHGAHMRINFVSAQHAGGGAQIFNTSIGAAADAAAIDPNTYKLYSRI